MRQIRLEAEEEAVDERLDKYLGSVLPDQSRSWLQKLIKKGAVRVNGKAVKASCRLEAEDQIEIDLQEPEELPIPAEDIPLDILYEDADLLIVNKPKGMVVHPAAGHRTGTLVNAVLYHCRGQLSGINGVLRPGIVHRIDRDTTGALVVCKNDRAHVHVAEQLKEHTITRRYVAVVAGVLREDEGTVDAPIGRHPADRKRMAAGVKNGKRAVTHYRVLRRMKGHTLIECRLETGRTHQIRVHMASIHHPILGDTVYGASKDPYHLEGQALHARVLGLVHPVTGAYIEVEAPVPEYMQALLEKLEKM
ncbi:MAG: RluA family pseudouridine synthase [Lachnospiraceae bacterium]|nr:RluA family pseudouridine synthase [Lachnospiraceae bacterium]